MIDANIHLKYQNYKIHETHGEMNIIIGDGLMAKAFLGFNLDKKVLIFASGVSNSNEEDKLSFDKEKKLFLDIYKDFSDYTVVYFSTCSIFDPSLKNKPYVIHKREMENLISNTVSSYYIFRLPTIVGKSNSQHTLTNYLYNNIIKGAHFSVWQNAKRYLIDIDDVYRITRQLIADNISPNQIINVAFFQYPIFDIIQTLEKIIGKKGLYTLTDEGGSFAVDTNTLDNVLPYMKPKNAQTYLEGMLMKYYNK